MGHFSLIEAAMYRAIGLLQPNADFTMEGAFARLQARFPGYTVTQSGATVTVAKGDWWIAVALVTGSQLRDETEWLVGKLAGLEPVEANSFVTSERRVEVWTDVPDPFMEHFNDFLSVVEVLKGFHGILVVDPKAPGVL
jgi:hypothetical protein